jgi:hypothetical protein
MWQRNGRSRCWPLVSRWFPKPTPKRELYSLLQRDLRAGQGLGASWRFGTSPAAMTMQPQAARRSLFRRRPSGRCNGLWDPVSIRGIEAAASDKGAPKGALLSGPVPANIAPFSSIFRRVQRFAAGLPRASLDPAYGALSPERFKLEGGPAALGGSAGAVDRGKVPLPAERLQPFDTGIFPIKIFDQKERGRCNFVTLL